MSNTIVLIGAGSSNFGLETLSELFADTDLHGSRIVLHDINATALDSTLGRAQRHIERTGVPFVVSAEIDRRRALANAAFVLISIEAGDRFALWDLDREIPLHYGYRQPYGENGGPGGLFHALRVAPLILEICADVMEICPNAVILNYTNPMSRVVQTVHEAFPDLTCFGLCHEVNSLARYLPSMLQLPREELVYRAAGLNHFSVLTEIRNRKTGEDLYPAVRDEAHDFFRTAVSAVDRVAGRTSGARPYGLRYLMLEVMKRFGYLPITEDSHFGEYLPWGESSSDRIGIHLFYQAYRSRPAPDPPEILIPPAPVEREWAVPIISAWITGRHADIPAVNMRNGQCIPDLPPDLVVEVPATIADGHLTPESFPDYPLEISALLALQSGTIRLTARAVVERSRRKAIQALLADPLTTDSGEAVAMLDEMIRLQSPYLDYLE